MLSSATHRGKYKRETLVTLWGARTSATRWPATAWSGMVEMYGTLSMFGVPPFLDIADLRTFEDNPRSAFYSCSCFAATFLSLAR